MTKHSKRKVLSYTQGIAPTKERQRQCGGVVVEPIHENNGGRIYTRLHRAKFSNILDAYLWHKVISDPEHEAGQRFNREYSRSVLKIRVYDGAGSHGDPGMASISAINGNEVLRKVFDLLSPAQRGIIIFVCVENNWAGRESRIRTLRRALKILTKHWKMIPEEI